MSNNPAPSRRRRPRGGIVTSFHPTDMRNLRPLLPTLLLLVAYLVADTCFGPVGGLVAAVVLGGGEFAATWIRHKRPDIPALCATLFFIAIGTLSVAFDGTSFERVQPAVVEAATCLLLAFFAYSKAGLDSLVPESCRGSIRVTPSGQRAMKCLLRALLVLLAAHTAFSAVSAYTLPADTHAFVSGPLLYILVALFFLTVIVKNRLLARAAAHDEWLPVVDEQGQVVGKATRRECHAGSMLLHPVVHLHILNPRGDIYLQRRSMKKKLLPGRWDTAVGGHVDFGEKIEDALKREAREELGLERFRARFLGSYLWESPRERELVFPFLCGHHSPIRPVGDEVAEGRFLTRAEIEDPANSALLTPQFLHEYQRLLRHLPAKP